MPLPLRRRLFGRAAVWTGVSLVLGLLILVIGVGQQWPDVEDAGTAESALRAELFVHIIFGIIALVCLPITLSFDGRTIGHHTLRPKVLAAERLREFLTSTGRGGEEFLTHEGSVESLQRRTGGWIPITVGIVGILAGTISFFGVAAASILVITLAARQSWLLSFATILAAMASQSLAYIITPYAVGEFELPVFLVSGTAFAVLVVIGVIRGAREQGLIDTAAQTLLRDRSRQDRAIAEVRRGIARDMHDSLSHHLSVIAMYAGALSVRNDLEPDAVHESARLIAASARRSGAELREVLTMLRGDDQGAVVDPDIDRLVAERSGTAVLTYVEPVNARALHSLGALERTTIYRFVQEAMTNAVKHAPGQTLSIMIAGDLDGQVTRFITMHASNDYPTNRLGEARPADDEQSIAPARTQYIAGSGLGLLGLRERMEAMGGDLTVTHFPRFELSARIPIQDPAEERA